MMEIAPCRDGSDEEIAVPKLNQDQKRQPAVTEFSLAGFQGSFTEDVLVAIDELPGLVADWVDYGARGQPSTLRCLCRRSPRSPAL
jgi:hypothetical protein